MSDNSTKNVAADLPAETAIHYDQFFGPFYFEPYAIEIANRIDIPQASVILEIAAGTGRITRHIRERISPAAKLIASDISGDMLAVAKKKLRDSTIDWQIIDAQQLPFDDGSIDVVVCCFGYMFVPDKPKAFAEVSRVLKTGGQFLFTTWDKLENNAASFCARSIAAKYLNRPVPASYNLPTSMHDEAGIQTLLKEAGFSKMSIEKKQLDAVSATAKEAAAGLLKGGVYDEIRAHDPSAIEEIKIKLEKELTEKFGGAPMIAPMSALICEAWKQP
ncbi:methyltransferase domain-containing protein [Terrimonas sp. NA20]|uniref:Methyltransferase domain-containing protein n=1 Tax=Terrimonas ginsenosidimutans TaxID=2908004 RepID=A0ABS9KXT0_9BACT|nr:class I SAM-dependent methyltransferase [Terrimonas ginsenosidimutans]MCG2617116.1 methyltransferase domain-containing protein [Terrimonas ginsenosidimutans]